MAAPFQNKMNWVSLSGNVRVFRRDLSKQAGKYSPINPADADRHLRKYARKYSLINAAAAADSRARAAALTCLLHS